MKNTRRNKPVSSQMFKFKEERSSLEQGYGRVAGVDEVGRGCLAGPVVAAAVIVPWDRTPGWYRQVRDSKLLTPAQREHLAPLIHQVAISVGTGVVYPDIIDRWGMTAAVRLAMRQAIEHLAPAPDFVLIDYLTVPDCSVPNKGVRDGDGQCFSIACASIVAKVFRDHLMGDLDHQFPGYALADNKGYGTADHLYALHRHGPCPLHRQSFGPVRDWNQMSLDDLLRLAHGTQHDEA